MWFNMILLQLNEHFKAETQTLFRDELNKTLYRIKYCAFIILLPTVHNNLLLFKWCHN